MRQDRSPPSARPIEIRGQCFALFVHPAHEGHGYGRALLAEAEAWLFGAGWETIWLHTSAEPHLRAHGFYRAAGWMLAGPADHGDVRYEKRRAV
jgi:GNAT superfamily N-acetyltransferase